VPNDTGYTVPDDPPDPEAAALDLMVHLTDDDALKPILARYCNTLHVCGAFAGLGWPDAKRAATAASFDVCTRGDAADFLRKRVLRVWTGTDRMLWHDPEAGARALAIAAAVWEL
jgi:hypothetical protein